MGKEDLNSTFSACTVSILTHGTLSSFPPSPLLCVSCYGKLWGCLLNDGKKVARVRNSEVEYITFSWLSEQLHLRGSAFFVSLPSLPFTPLSENLLDIVILTPYLFQTLSPVYHRTVTPIPSMAPPGRCPVWLLQTPRCWDSQLATLPSPSVYRNVFTVPFPLHMAGLLAQVHS